MQQFNFLVIESYYLLHYGTWFGQFKTGDFKTENLDEHNY